MTNMHISVGIYINDKQTNRVIGHKPNEQFETSSTIKVPIIYLALKKAADTKIPLNRMFFIEPRHRSNGSGIINWTNWKKLTLADLITSITTYSDCVATNVLIDFIGGKNTINAFLKNQTPHTRLIMPQLNFPETVSGMPKVGITTAFEMSRLFSMLIESDWPDEYQKFITEVLANVDTSWFQEMLPKNLEIGLWHKTGSMINVDSQGDTVFNAVGLIRCQRREFHFALMSRTKFEASATDKNILQLRRHLVVEYFINSLKELMFLPTFVEQASMD